MSNFRCDAALEHQTYVIFMYVHLCLSVNKVEMNQDKVP